MRRIVLLSVVALAIACLVTWHADIQHWLAIHTGTLNESGPYYAFFSGFGSDLGELTLVTGLLAVLRHKNCHTQGCWRIGRPVDGTPYLACPRHHPAHHGTRRNVSLDLIRRAHHQAQALPPNQEKPVA